MSYSLNDPRLQALEARLAATPPQASSAQRQQLLYQCAFAAGQRATNRTPRRWQAAVAGLLVLLVCASIPLARERALPVNRGARQSVHADLTPQRIQTEPEITLIGRRPAAKVVLDAWQVQSSATAPFDHDLAQFAKTDPRLRSLTLGALTHRILEE